MRIRLIQLEAIATIAWFLMDMLWMWNQVKIGMILLPFIVVPMVITFLRTSSANVLYIVIITLCWLTMNSLWMISDLFTEESNHLTFILLKAFATSSGIAGMTFLIKFFITREKKIKPL